MECIGRLYSGVDDIIVKEYFMTRNDGVKLYKSYSDNNKIIHKIGTQEEYSDAIDVEDAPYVYEETDKEISKYPD